MRRTVLAATLLLLAPIAAACSGSEDGPTENFPTANADGFSITSALAQLPASTDGQDIVVQTGDLATATELAGLTRPTEPNPDAVIGWIGPISGGPSASPTGVYVPIADGLQTQYLANIADFDEELGWSIIDVDTFAEMSLPPNTITVVTGDFDEGTMSDLPEHGDGLVTAGEGEDLAVDMAKRTTARPLGAPLRLAQRDGAIAFSGNTAPVQAWFDREGTTLAEDESLAASAAVLDDHDAYAAMLVKRTGGHQLQQATPNLTPAQLEALTAQYDEFLPEEPFDTIALGWAWRDGEALLLVAYHFDSAEAAEASAPRLEKGWSEGIAMAGNGPLSDYVTVGGVATTDAVVLVELTLAEEGRANILASMLMRGEFVFAHK